MSTELLLPYALDSSGALIHAAVAAKAVYSCPACFSPVIFRLCTAKRSHFAHRAETGCTNESVLHATAKRLIVQAVERWRTGTADAPIIFFSCPSHGHIKSHPLKLVESAKLEVSITTPLNFQYRLDCGLFIGDTLTSAVEVRVTHAVDILKFARLHIPTIEVEGSTILDNPLEWHVLAHNTEVMCHKCWCDAFINIRLERYLKLELGIDNCMEGSGNGFASATRLVDQMDATANRLYREAKQAKTLANMEYERRNQLQKHINKLLRDVGYDEIY